MQHCFLASVKRECGLRQIKRAQCRKISRAQSMESIGSSITNSMVAVRENASTKLEHTLDDAVDAMGDAMFNNTLVSGITSMFGKEEETVKEEEGYLKRISSWRKGKA